MIRERGRVGQAAALGGSLCVGLGCYYSISHALHSSVNQLWECGQWHHLSFSWDESARECCIRSI